MDALTEAESAMLFEWTRSALDEAVVAGFVTPPWRPTEEMYARMHGYYRAGLTPSEAAQAAFGTKH